MKISSVRTQVVGAQWKNWVLVAVETDDGVVGVGEATMGYTALPAEGAVRELAAIVVGLDPTDPEAMRAEASRAWEHLTDAVHQTAVSALEVACWDLLGKQRRAPLWELIGPGDGSGVPVYANGWYRGAREPVEVATRASLTVEAGFAALKFDPFGTAKGTLPPSERDRSVEIVAAVRERVGPAIALMIDAHDRFDVPTAISITHALQPFGLAFLEAPCDSSSIGALAAVANESPIPIAAGERFTDVEAFRRLAGETGIRIWQPETLTLGVAAMRRINELAIEHGASVMPHNARGPVCTAVNVHLCAALSSFEQLEYFVDDAVPLARRIASDLPRVIDGRIHPSTEPGLGIEIDWLEAARHPFDPTHRLDFGREGWERRLPGQSVDGPSQPRQGSVT